jgi:hypothetical protein
MYKMEYLKKFDFKILFISAFSKTKVLLVFTENRDNKLTNFNKP